MNASNPLALDIQSLTKVYHSYARPFDRLKELIVADGKAYSREVRALDDISLQLPVGGRLGIIGENGSGKSTLLKVIAGVLSPTEGSVKVNGRVSALLELGAGFNPNLSGRENILQFCMLHGLAAAETERAVPEIIAFSELGDAIDHPLKVYSSGMSMRLGFACAVYVKPDILIVDEALSVGDAYFQNKCLHKIKSLLDGGTTFLYVTHAADAIRSLCETAIWLENGRVRMKGSASDVGAAYQSAIFSRMVRAGLEPPSEAAEASTSDPHVSGPVSKRDPARIKAFEDRVAPLRTGSGEIRIDDIEVINSRGEETDTLDFGEETTIRVFFHARKELATRAVLNVGIMDRTGRQLVHMNPMFQDAFASDAPLDQPHVIDFRFRNPLCPGEYGVAAGIAVLTMDPRTNAQTLIAEVIDYCAGGSRFSILYPEDKEQRDLWGVVHIDYDAKMRAID